MQIIDNEISILLNKINEGFVDPFTNNNLKNFILNGSKYIRARLAILFLKSQNYNITDDIYIILAAGELIHNASLLHDDVIDDAETRRGTTTIAKEINPKVSILAGNYLLSTAVNYLLNINNDTILTNFNNCITKMIEAEFEQFFLRGNIPTKDSYLRICKQKTASLFSTILKSCAYILQVDSSIFERFGELYGISFQIKNDLEIKSRKTDEKNGIYTAKDIMGIEKTYNLLDNYKEELYNILNKFSDNIYKRELEGLIDLL